MSAGPASPPSPSSSAGAAPGPEPRPPRQGSVVLVGLMGAGKTAVGRRLARALGLPFTDADHEIEAAAGMPITDIFELYGEPAFRDLERRVIARLLDGPSRRVLALGGGAFIDPETRARVRGRGLSVWLRADLDTLVRRTARRTNRPLLNGREPRAVLARLMEQRYPVYAEADVAVDSGRGEVEDVVRAVLDAIAARDAGGGSSP